MKTEFNRDKKVVSNVIEALRKHIIEHNLSEGDQLESEQMLAEKFGVSRGILREALQYFKTLGIIESRPRRGITLLKFLPDNIFADYIPFCRGKRCLDEIKQLRMIIDFGMAATLPPEGCPKQSEKLKRIARAMKTASPQRLLELESTFHETMFSIYKNRFLDTLRPFVVDYFRQAIANNRIDPAAESVKHLEIANAVAGGDSSTLVKLLCEHYKL